MRPLVFVCFLISSVSTAICQDLIWGAHFSSTAEFPASGSGPTSSFEDEEGNVYVTGQFSGKIDFDPGPNDLFFDATSHTEMFVLKMSKSGTLLWAKQFHGNFAATGKNIIGTQFDEIYVSGQFRGTVDFDPGPDSVSINNGNQFAGFLLKLNKEGEFIWVKKYDVIFNTLVMQSSGNFVTIGTFSGTKDIDPGPDVINLTSMGGSDIAVIKLNSFGDLISGFSIGGAGDDKGLSCDSDLSGNVYLTGSFEETVDFDPGPDSAVLIAKGIFFYDDIFICKFNALNVFQWVNGFGSTSYLEAGNVIHIDRDQNPVVAGRFAGSIDFDPGTGINQLNSGGGFGSFICKYTSEGQLVWANSFESPNSVIITAMDIDNSNFISCAGFFERSAEFNPLGQSFILTSPDGASESAFVCNLNPEGRFRWAIPFTTDNHATSNSVMYDRDHNLYTCGEFVKVGDFDPGPDSLIFEVPGTFLNGYVIKLQTCVPTTSDVSVIACKQYASPSGRYMWTQSGIYMDSIYNVDGCDSVMTINLEVLHTDTMVTYAEPTLFAFLSGNLTYQWLDCNNGYAIIPGETNQSFTPQSSGSYAVALYPDNLCYDTSACHNVILVGVQSPENETQVLLFPNPSNEELHVSIPFGTIVDKIIFRNMTGGIISQYTSPKGGDLISTSGLSNGLYVAEIHTADRKVLFQKVIVQ